jgi:chemotaxis protein CheC
LNFSEPTPLQLDALREIANVGCGHAASALSKLVGGRKVEIAVPHAGLAQVAELPRMLGGEGLPVVAAGFDIVGQLTGHLLVVLPQDDAQALTGHMLRQQQQGPLEGDHRDAFSEVGNILASACLSAIGSLSGFKLLPSVPNLKQDLAGRVVAEEALQRKIGLNDVVVVLEARFATVASPPFSGQLLVLPDPASLRLLLQKLGV